MKNYTSVHVFRSFLGRVEKIWVQHYTDFEFLLADSSQSDTSSVSIELRHRFEMFEVECQTKIFKKSHNNPPNAFSTRILMAAVIVPIGFVTSIK